MREQKISAKQLFGQNLRTVRLKKNLSQEELSELSGLHRTYISAVERGERNISVDNMERLAKSLDTSLISLLSIQR